MKISLISMILIAWSNLLFAQEAPNGKLIDILSKYEKENEIKFSYDSDLIASVNAQFPLNISINDIIKLVEKELPFKISKITDEYYSISAVETAYTLQVTDTVSNQPILPKDIIMLLNGQPTRVVYTDSSIVFNYKPNIADILLIYSIGYDRRTIPMEYLLNQKMLFQYLESPLINLSEIVIEDYLTKGINLNPSSQSISIKVNDLPLLPGETDGDIFASLTALPGVTSPDGRAGNIIVRGSDSDQTLVLYDNIPIYHKGHYYGTISPYNPKAVDYVEIYRSGFHPRLGDRVGGAIVIESTQKNNSFAKSGIGMNTLYWTGYSKVPIIKNKLGLSASARRSFPRAFQSPKLTAISESVFSGTVLVNPEGNVEKGFGVLFEDYNTKLIWNVNDKNTVALSSIYTNTNIDYSIDILGSNILSEENSFQNSGLNLDWNFKINEEWTANSSITYSKYNYGFITNNSQPRMPDFKALNGIKDFSIQYEISKSNKEGYEIQLGVDYKWQSVSLDYLNARSSDSTLIVIKTLKSANLISPFFNFEYSGMPKWYFQVGVRATNYDLLNDFRISPRALINYDATGWLTFKTSHGWYNQYLNQVKGLEYGAGGFDSELWSLADNNQSNIVNGTQSMIGVLLNLNSWIVDVEYFRKTANDISLSQGRKLQIQNVYRTIDYETSGLDLLLKRQVNKHTSLWLGYSLNDSKLKIDQSSVIYASKYVQPHVLYLGAAYSKNNFKFSTSWKYSSGLYVKSLDIIDVINTYERNLANLPPGARIPPNPFENLAERYPNVHTWDASASYTIPQTDTRKWSATFGLSLLNILNVENLNDRVYRGQEGFRDRERIGFAPNLMVMFEW